MIVPFILYNLMIAGMAGDPFAAQLLAVTMISGGVWTMSLGDGWSPSALSSCSSRF